MVVVGLELAWLPAVSLVASDGTPFSRPEILVLPVISLSIVGGAYGARLIRAAVADAARMPHVQAARLAGLGESRVLLRHLLPSAIPPSAQVLAFMVPFLVRDVVPNLARPLLADAGLRFIGAIYLVAAAGFLGFGPPPPSTDWGSMISENVGGAGLNSRATIGPSLMVLLLTIPTNLLADRYARQVAR